MPRPTVAIVGAGFAGLEAAKQLRGVDADVYLIDESNHHTFQPLLYQVATAGLSPGNIAVPIRRVFRGDRNIAVVMGRVDSIDTDQQRLRAGERTFPYDYLVVATGARPSYFGHDGWESIAPGLKTLDDAIEIRRRYLLAFESAELEADAEARSAALTFIVVGGGPTGVEMAGAMAEIARESIQRDFRRIDTRTARVLLIDGGDRLLRSYEPELSARAKRDLEALGVEVRLESRVVDVRDDAVVVRGIDGEHETIGARNVVWAAGVRATPLIESIGCELDRGGRALVRPDLSVDGCPNVFVLGDAASIKDARTGSPVPGVAPAAMQMGRHVGRIIREEIKAGGEGDHDPASNTSERPAFVYRDKGSMATIGRGRAIAQVAGLRIAGLPAWLAWGAVHIAFLVGFRSKLLACIEWVWLYLFYSRGVRLITGQAKPTVLRTHGEDTGEVRRASAP